MTQSIPELLEYLYSLERAGIKLGLEPTRRLLAGVGNPEKSMPLIQIAGTNGKGSTAAILNAILQAHGKHVGLYTSPHLDHFNERIRVDGVCISEAEIALWLRNNRELIETIEATFFEATTVLALSHFAQAQVEHAILETGLGGRLDATTAAAPGLTALTPISYDHMEILGGSLAKIAEEKAGIMRAGVRCVSVPQHAEVTKVLKKRADAVGAQLEFLDVSLNKLSPAGLPGKHQVLNTQLARRLAEIALANNFSPTHANAALAKVRWPGRYQVVSSNPRTIYDVAHNPHGIGTFLETFSTEDSQAEKILVLALQAGKSSEDILAKLEGYFQTIIMTQSGIRQFIPAAELARVYSGSEAQIYIVADPEKAIKLARNKSGESGIIAILGSHYLGPAVAISFKISFDKLY